MKPQCFIMVGLPGSGKSTIVEDLKKEIPSIQVASTDNYIEEYAKKKNSTYNKVFDEAIKDATSNLKVDVLKYMALSVNFIWDQTNLNKKSRKDKINILLKNGYEVTIIVMKISDEEQRKRLSERNKLGNKYISSNLVNSMKDSYEEPSYDENVSNIYFVNENKEWSLKEKNQNENKL